MHNDATRTSLRRQLAERDVAGELFDRGADPYPDDFVRAVTWLFEHHERIKTSPRRVWSPAHQMALRD